MVARMRSYLAAAGVDVSKEMETTRLIFSSDQNFVNGLFDVDRMMKTLEFALDQALRDGYQGLWATGDMAWEFGSEQNFQKLLQYELRLEGLFRQQPALCGICQYRRDTLPREVMAQGLLTHQTFFINEMLSQINPHYVGLESNIEASETPEWDQVINKMCHLQNELNPSGS
jgi:hypothetical protein